VLVVGAGNSATEIALDLLGAGETVSLSVRTPPNIVRRDTHGFPSQLLAEPSGLLREIGLEARAVGRTLAAVA
jgi:cation diffusion facilitator CzcD-associated flavoprotein CzcO